MNKFSSGFISKNPINNGGVSIKVPTEEEAAREAFIDPFKKLDKKSGFSKGVEENKQWAKDNPGKAIGLGLFTVAKWSPWGFKKYYQGGKLAVDLIKKLF